LADIRDSIVPYRANRRALELESSEDYELVLMQLCAGEGGFAITEPEDVQELFGMEVRSTNPDLGLLQLHENAAVSLRAGPVAEALNHAPELAFAPPGTIQASRIEAPNVPEPRLPNIEPLLDDSLPDDVPSHCGRCAGVLPPNHVVNFCPHCGGDLGRARCPACQANIEAGWRHCVTCGTSLNRS
jgi:hypothetical protein